MSREHGKLIVPDTGKYAGYAENKKYTCPIDKSDPDHRHKHSSNTNMYIHREYWGFCGVEVYLTRMRDREGNKYDVINSIHIGSMGTVVKLPAENAKQIGRVVRQLLQSMEEE